MRKIREYGSKKHPSPIWGGIIQEILPSFLWIIRLLLLYWLVGGAYYVSARDETESEQDVLIIEEDRPLIIEEGDDSFIIEEDESEPSGIGYWTQHFSGSLAAGYSGIGDDLSSRYNIQGRLRYIEEWDPLSLVLEGRIYHSFLQFTFRDRQTGEEFSRDIVVDNIELLESYVDVDLNRVLLSAGRKRIVFGQFDLFSPVDLWLPIDFAGTILSFSKVDNRLPQNVLSAGFFLPAGFEIHYYYFPNLITDALTSDLTRSIAYEDEHRNTVYAPFEEPEDEAQQALRLLYVSPAITVGLSFFQGYLYFSENLRTLAKDANGNYICRGAFPNARPEVFSPTHRCIRSREDTFFTSHSDYVYRPFPTLPENRAIGFELAVPAGRTTYKFEWSRNDIPQRIGSELYPRDRPFFNYLEWVISENDGKEYVDTTQNLFALGLDYYSDRRIINFNIITGYIEYDDHAQRGVDLAIEASSNDDNDDFIFPVFHIAGNYGPNLDHRVGWALGSVGVGIGTTLYYQNNAVESMLFVTSIDILEYLNDSTYESEVETEAQKEGSNVDRQEKQTLSLRVGFNYSF